MMSSRVQDHLHVEGATLRAVLVRIAQVLAILLVFGLGVGLSTMSDAGSPPRHRDAVSAASSSADIVDSTSAQVPVSLGN